MWMVNLVVAAASSFPAAVAEVEHQVQTTDQVTEVEAVVHNLVEEVVEQEVNFRQTVVHLQNQAMTQ